MGGGLCYNQVNLNVSHDCLFQRLEVSWVNKVSHCGIVRLFY